MARRGMEAQRGTAGCREHRVNGTQRHGGAEGEAVALNFSSSAAMVETGGPTGKLKLISTNYGQVPVKNRSKTGIRLRPYEALIYKL